MHSITQACTGCTACARICPVYAITGERGKRHDISAKRCIDCGACGRVCPAHAILDASGAQARKDGGPDLLKPAVDAQVCSACALCVHACRRECLNITLPRFKGDIGVVAALTNTARCISCGLCATICPLKAIRMEKEGAPV